LSILTYGIPVAYMFYINTSKELFISAKKLIVLKIL